MAKPISTTAIEKETGLSWKEWVGWLDSEGARDLTHTEIARKIHESGKAGDWWAQSVTVAYEQHIGRRVPGQRSDGKFEISVTKTLSGTMDDILMRWCDVMKAMPDIKGQKITKGPLESASEDWRYWRAWLADDSKVKMYISKKAAGKILLAVMHENMKDSEEAEQWRVYWKSILAEF